MIAYVVREPSDRELKFFLEMTVLPRVIEVKGAFLNDELAAIAGIVLDPAACGTLLEDDAELFGFFNSKPGIPTGIGLDIVRRMRDFIRGYSEPIYIQHDNAFPTSEKFLRALGFKPTHKMRTALHDPKRTLRLWIWQR